MAFSSGSRSGPQSDINVTPLVDVVLVLLIIFMVVTPLLQVGLDADIPKPSDEPAPPPEQQQEQVIVQVKDDGSIWLNSDKVTESQLTERVTAMLKKKSKNEKLAFLAGTDNIQFGRIVHVMDVLRGCGAKDIGIIDPIPTG